MSSRASQKEGVARQAMETTRMTWSCHLSRYRAATMPRIVAKMTATKIPMKVSWSVIGKAAATMSEILTPVKEVPRSPWARPRR